MSNDLPDMHRSSREMARVLTTYMDDPRKVRSAILIEFERSPSLCEIQRLRKDHLAGGRRKRRLAPACPHDGYWPSEASERAAAANQIFLERLRWAYPERFVA